VAVSYPADGASAPPGSQLVEGSAGSAPGDLPNVTVRLFGGDGTTILQSIAVKAVGGKWSATFGGLPAGHYIVRAEQGDEAGNQETTPPRSFSLVEPVAAPAKQMPPPSAALAWFPVAPHTGEPVSLVSSSTDSGSPITSFAWDLAGNGAFQPGGQVLKTSFTAPGNHTVRLRVADANGLASVASATIAVTSPVAPLMRPYPIVRLLTSRTAAGIRLRQLTVQAPPGARIAVTCRSRLCPVKPQSLSVKPGTRGAIEFKRFQRSLRIGVIIEIRVWQPGLVGKYTRLTVRRGKPPSRFDSCLSASGTIPITCPTP
jgi:PKD repeat protein